ncbi:hypothetical protein PAPHI01_0999 [Pancytospora philotis]|nr:hypothetical protein PAPHI01_0999 [Pancytospora philotis]
MAEAQNFLRDKVRVFAALPAYADISVSAEGYGTLIGRDGLSGIHLDLAEALRRSAEACPGAAAVPAYLEGLYAYLRALSQPGGSAVVYAARTRQACKFLDGFLNVVRQHELRHLKDILKWVLFNLKLSCLFRERECLQAQMELKGYEYVLNELKSLQLLYSTAAAREFHVVPVKELEAAIKQRLAKNNNSYA